MSVDPKKPVVLKNRTNYFVPSISRVRVRFSSSDTYQAFNSKCEGYESRLYWEFRRSEDLGGKTFFYTLTYNDKNVPSFEGQPCFDYDHLRHFLNGGFKKILLRRFGTNMRYFVGAELGDGKGSRGLHNNPHYHILFFLRPDESGKYPYVPISRWLFRHYIRLYWQGFDQDIDLREGSFHSFKDAFLGIVKEGSLHMGEVLDFRAISYVSKYVTKDVDLVKHEATIEKNFRLKYNKEFRYSYDSYVRFLHSFIYDNFNIPTDSRHSDWTLSDKELAYHLEPEFCKRCKAINDFNQVWIPDFVRILIKHYNLQKDYKKLKFYLSNYKTMTLFAIYESSQGWKQLLKVVTDAKDALKQTAWLKRCHECYNYTAYMSTPEGGFVTRLKFCRNGKLIGFGKYYKEGAQ